MIELKKKKLSASLSSFRLFLSGSFCGTEGARGLASSSARLVAAASGPGRAGWRARCSGQRSSQAGRRGKAPSPPRFTHPPCGEAMGACCSPRGGTQTRAGREVVAPGRGARKEENVLPKPGCGARRRLQPFPPETEEAGEEEAENAEEEVARRARLARGAGRRAAGATPGRGPGSAAVVVRKRGAAGRRAASLGPGSQTAASVKPPPPRVPRDRGVESRGDASRLPGRSGHPTPAWPSLRRHKWSVMIRRGVPGREGLRGHLIQLLFCSCSRPQIRF